MKETFINLKKVYKYGKEFKKNMIIFTTMSVIFMIFNIITPIIGAKQILYLSTSVYKQLIAVSVLILIIEFISALNVLILRKNTGLFFRGTSKKISLLAAKEILKIELTDIDKQNSGVFIQRIGNDTDEMPKIFTRGMGMLFNVLTNIGIFVAVFIVNKVVFFYYLICAIILSLLHIYSAGLVNEEDKKYRKQREKTSGLISELVRGVRDIKMLYAKNSFINEIDKSIDDLTTSQFSMRNVEMKYKFITDSLSALIEFFTIVILVYLLSKSYITVGVALILYNYKSRVLYNLMNNFGDLLTEVKSFNLSSNRVFSLLEGEEFKKETFGTNHIDHINGNFEFKNVHFGYDKKEVLKGISFKIKENETIAFVGKSGVGKTTIFSLLCKLYDIKSGEILIDGKNIKDLDEESIRNNITIISQNPYIFNMSIRDNLRLVKDNLTDKEINQAIKMACLDKFIESLPDKYDTIVGEGGVTLSGGQRQRLAIARAFVQNTKIILFDEATSSLDNETQRSIQEAINNMKDNYTILIIAHRLSTIINSDKIMLIEDGVITAKGTHQKLLNTCKNYKKLYESEVIEK
jgi:ABC-type multidrug transport system fused ATPase/permease subunit